MQKRSAAQLREVTPEQYVKGMVAMGGWRIPFGRILRTTENGTYIVAEPKPTYRTVRDA